jgi:tetratricopeptide (TPR) repeat protein
MKRIIYFGCAVLMTGMLATAFAKPLMAQDDGNRYTEYYAEADQARKAALGEKFLADFKDSTYTDGVYRATVTIYYKLNNWPKVLDLAGKMDQLDPSIEAKNKPQIFSIALDAAQKSGSVPQILNFGEKILTLLPEDLNALIVLSSTLLYSSPNDAAAVDKAAGYATRGLAVVEKIDAKAVGLSEAEWGKQKTGIQGTLHTTLGSIAFNKKDYDKSVEELTTATKLVPNDGNSWYLIGFSYYMQTQELIKKTQDAFNEMNDMIKKHADKALIDEAKGTAEAFQDASREKREQAMAALAVAVNCGGTTQQPAMQQLMKIWQSKNNNSTDGLQDYIKSKKPAQ